MKFAFARSFRWFVRPHRFDFVKPVNWSNTQTVTNSGGYISLFRNANSNKFVIFLNNYYSKLNAHKLKLPIFILRTFCIIHPFFIKKKNTQCFNQTDAFSHIYLMYLYCTLQITHFQTVNLTKCLFLRNVYRSPMVDHKGTSELLEYSKQLLVVRRATSNSNPGTRDNQLYSFASNQLIICTINTYMETSARKHIYAYV